MPSIIWKNTFSQYAPGPYLKSKLLQKHIANMVLEQYSLKYCCCHKPNIFITQPTPDTRKPYQTSISVHLYGTEQ